MSICLRIKQPLPAVLAVYAAFLPAAYSENSQSVAVLREVIVTAALRRTSETDLPSSVTVIGSQTVSEPGVQHFADVLEQVPNLNWSGGTSRPRFFQVRGIGELDQYQGAPNPSVGFLIDDIDFSGVGMPATLFDVSQVEVLRGPQGARYGANALAGLINIKTRDPSATQELSTEVSLAQQNTWSAGVAASGPITNELNGRVAVQRYRSDGFVHNIFLNRNTNGRDELTTRGKLRWQPSAKWQIDFAGLYVNIDNGFDAFSIDNSLTMRSNQPGRDAQRSLGSSIVAKRNGVSVDFQSTSAYANSNILYSFDGDWASDAYWGVSAPYDYFSRFLRYRRTLSEDLRWSSHTGHELFGKLAWVLGTYVLDLHENNNQVDAFENTPYNTLQSQYQATNIAIYGQGDWLFHGGTTLQFGLRGEHRGTQYSDSALADFSPSENMLGGNISLLQAFGAHNAYVTLSRGYKAGGFNIGPQVPDDHRTFDAEYLWNLETGVKGGWLEQRLQASVAVFYSRREHEQVSRSFQPDPTNPLTYVFITENAARGENFGLESNWRYQLAKSWQLDGSLGLLRTQYLDYSYPDPSGGTRDLSGRSQAHAPSYEYSLGLMWHHPLGWSVRAETSGKASYYFDTSHDQSSKSYALVNFRAGYEVANWSIMLAARNLLNENYAVRGFYFNVDPSTYPTPGLYTQRGDSRQIGVTVRWSLR